MKKTTNIRILKAKILTKALGRHVDPEEDIVYMGLGLELIGYKKGQ